MTKTTQPDPKPDPEPKPEEAEVVCAFCGDCLPKEEAVHVPTLWGDTYVCPECYEEEWM